jgi:hypothetical protein
MMKFIVVALTIASTAFARPQFGPPQQQAVSVSAYSNGGGDGFSSSPLPPVPIINQSEINNGDGSYTYSFEAGNGIQVENSGTLKKVIVPRYDGDGLAPNDPPQEQDIVVQTGSYSYPAPDGSLITIRYIADENGFQPQGDSIPTPPPVPQDILNSLQQQPSQGSFSSPQPPPGFNQPQFG